MQFKPLLRPTYYVLVLVLSLTLSACGAESTPATGQTSGSNVSSTSSSKVQELLSFFPDKPDYLELLSFNNYAALRKRYNIPDNLTVEDLVKNKDIRTRMNSYDHYTITAPLLKETFDKVRETAGYDFLQANYEVVGGGVSHYFELAQGNFDFPAIDKAWLSNSFVSKTTIGSNSLYSFDKLDPNIHLTMMFGGGATLLTIPEQKLIMIGAKKTPLPEFTTASQNQKLPEGKTIKDNPQVKAMLESFGDPDSFYIGTSLIKPLLYDIKTKASDRVHLPQPLLAGFAYYDDGTDIKNYQAITYYNDADTARKSQITLDKLMKDVNSHTKLPLTTYWEVLSSEIKGNMLIYKLKWKSSLDLNYYHGAYGFPMFYY